MFWYTTTGWMMWNFLVGSMLVGGVPVLYDGSPGHPNLDACGTSRRAPGESVRDERRVPRRLSEGRHPAGRDQRPVAPRGDRVDRLAARRRDFGWVYDAVKPDVWLASMSGGTDVVSAFVGGCPLLPVHAGELQAAALGARSRPSTRLVGRSSAQTGELVLTAPLPSMPVVFWNDPDGAPVPRELLRDVPRRLACTATGSGSRSGGARSSRAARIRPSIARGSGSARASCTGSSRASRGRRQPRHRAGAAGRRVSDAAVRASSPTASSWTPRSKARMQRGDPGGAVAAPHPATRSSRSRRSRAPDRQEDGGRRSNASSRVGRAGRGRRVRARRQIPERLTVVRAIRGPSADRTRD